MGNKQEILAQYESNRIEFTNVELTKPYPAIFTDNNSLPIKNFGTQFSDVIEPYAEEIQNQLNDPTKVVIRQFYDNNVVRATLKDNTIVNPIVNYFEELFGRKANKILVNRGYPSSVPNYQSLDDCDQNNYWLSQYWHIANFPNESLSLGIYLNDVDIDGGQIEHIKNPNYYFYNRFVEGRSLSRISNLILDEDDIISIVGPKFTTFAFVANFIHRGTFPRNGLRDFIRIRFD
jgi:hypothetical protein